ncbi:FtsW/RodA/SpoVE family cell cycle protein [Sporosarcina sp. ACRSM]|uniref:FtsW/RodA/SpoVE family cell cycle protein n=1 Tax=Sporosarcina sp. ACRSM TaxID=2918216 RepID=UPI001EF5F184|nr:FtsW/RodA/SpoVE family cell cycle protein [Sporosarcina sp. ACRSM]
MEKKSQSYLREVREQIKSKEAKNFVSAELDSHIKEAKNEWMKKGLEDAEAEEKAVGQMGSPVTLGQQLNKLHRPKVDWLTVILLVTAIGLGFTPILFVDADYSSQIGMGAGDFFKHKAIFAFLGGALVLGMMLLDYRKLAKLGWLFYLIGILILLMLSYFPTALINGMSVIMLGPFRLESLMAIPFFFLAWVSFFNNKRLKIWHLGLLFFLSCYLLLMVPSIPTTYIYVVMVFVLFWWSKFSRKQILTTMILSVGTCLLAVSAFWPLTSPYQKVRLLAFLNPEKYSNDEGFMILHIKKLMADAGWFGSSNTLPYLPGAHTDFVFVSFIYHYGWFFAAVLVLILCLLVARIIVIAHKIHDPYGKLLLIGAMTLYTVQLASNIGMTLGFLPMTSMSLPFISYGLMPTLFNAFLIGVVLSVYRRKDLVSSRSVQVTN